MTDLVTRSDSVAPTSRVQIFNRAPAPPGQCIQCGSAIRPVLDTNITIKWYGRLYFCITCVEEMGRAVGMVLKTELDAATQSFEDQLKEYTKSRDLVLVKNERLTDAVAHLDECLVSIVAARDVTYSPMETKERPADEGTLEDQLTVFDFISDDSESDTERPVESDNPFVGERPNVLSDSDAGFFRLE